MPKSPKQLEREIAEVLRTPLRSEGPSSQKTKRPIFAPIGSPAPRHRNKPRMPRGAGGHATKKASPSSKAVDFFRKHASYSYRPGESKAKAKTRGAQALARAEAEAEARGWAVEWEDDPEEWWGDTKRPFEVLTAVLRAGDGQVLASLGGNGMTGNRKTDADFRRVVEAELAFEALG